MTEKIQRKFLLFVFTFTWELIKEMSITSDDCRFWISEKLPSLLLGESKSVSLTAAFNRKSSELFASDKLHKFEIQPQKSFTNSFLVYRFTSTKSQQRQLCALKNLQVSNHKDNASSILEVKVRWHVLPHPLSNLFMTNWKVTIYFNQGNLWHIFT